MGGSPDNKCAGTGDTDITMYKSEGYQVTFSCVDAAACAEALTNLDVTSLAESECSGSAAKTLSLKVADDGECNCVEKLCQTVGVAAESCSNNAAAIGTCVNGVSKMAEVV